MLGGALITIREGLEAFIITGILPAYLRMVSTRDGRGRRWTRTRAPNGPTFSLETPTCKGVFVLGRSLLECAISSR